MSHSCLPVSEIAMSIGKEDSVLKCETGIVLAVYYFSVSLNVETAVTYRHFIRDFAIPIEFTPRTMSEITWHITPSQNTLRTKNLHAPRQFDELLMRLKSQNTHLQPQFPEEKMTSYTDNTRFFPNKISFPINRRFTLNHNDSASSRILNAKIVITERLGFSHEAHAITSHNVCFLL